MEGSAEASVDICNTSSRRHHEHHDTDALIALFDSVAASFENGVTYPAMAELVEGLAAIGAVRRGSAWIEHAKEVARTHPVSSFVFDCPFTRHSAMKPRGYPGDAQLIDYIYRHPAMSGLEQQASDFGRSVMLHNVDSPAPAAVRARRHLTATYIGDVVSQQPGAHIMSVACGHARELELITPKVARSIGRFVAYDQDASSLAVAASYSAKGVPVEPVQGTILQLLKDKTLTGFDLVFSAGLYDYLSDRLAEKLTADLFARLKPGGKLIVANFLPDIRDAGYMEIFMDWRLIYRNEHAIRGFAKKIDPVQIRSARYFPEPNRNVGFLELTRAGPALRG
jgi:extracellular factor (EF) 3-hydroxypalmitic acid methyl ester biosynthesis protein